MDKNKVDVDNSVDRIVSCNVDIMFGMVCGRCGLEIELDDTHYDAESRPIFVIAPCGCLSDPTESSP